jgi:hypothetical protein
MQRIVIAIFCSVKSPRCTTNFAAGAEPEFIAMGDLTGDGNLDLAVANVG